MKMKMKIIRYRSNGRIVHGILEDDGTIRELAGSPFTSLDTSGTVTRSGDVAVLAPVSAPRLIGVGLNYAAHAAEGNKTPPPQPMLFMLPSTAVIGPEEPIIYPRQGKENRTRL